MSNLSGFVKRIRDIMRNDAEKDLVLMQQM